MVGAPARLPRRCLLEFPEGSVGVAERARQPFTRQTVVEEALGALEATTVLFGVEIGGTMIFQQHHAIESDRAKVARGLGDRAGPVRSAEAQHLMYEAEIGT